MQKILFSAIIFLLLFLSAEGQTKINGITFPDTYSAGKDNLVLNGGGTRVKYWMDMYVGGLYLTSKSKDAAGIVSANTSMAIKINIVSGLISSSKMIEAVEEGFKKSTGGNTTPFKEKIEKFKNAFSEEIKKGDMFDIVYAGEKISVYKNKVLKTEIEGVDFKKAVFGIWLGNDPADRDLKSGMLGTAQ